MAGKDGIWTQAESTIASARRRSARSSRTCPRPQTGLLSLLRGYVGADSRDWSCRDRPQVQRLDLLECSNLRLGTRSGALGRVARPPGQATGLPLPARLGTAEVSTVKGGRRPSRSDRQTLDRGG